MRSACLCLTMSLLLFAASAQAGVYRCKDASGQVTVSDKPCAGTPSENLTRRYAQPAPKTEAAEAPDVVDEMARRRDYYMQQGYSKEEAAQMAAGELTQPRAPASPAPPKSKNKTAHDNMNEYLNMRGEEQAAQQRARMEAQDRDDYEEWRDTERKAKEAEAKRKADCDYERRIEIMRNGYSSRSCY